MRMKSFYLHSSCEKIREFCMKICYAFMMSLLLFSCKEKTSDMDKVKWVEGVWESTSGEGTFTENWVWINDTLMKGAGYFVTSDNDTTFREALSIENKNDTLYYVAAVAHNGDIPTKFKAVSISDKEMIFENKEHDFPQQIIYTRLSEKNMVAMITGMQNGKERTEKFELSRKD